MFGFVKETMTLRQNITSIHHPFISYTSGILLKPVSFFSLKGFECYSNLQKERESDRKQHAQSLLEMTEESQNAKTEREKAEKYVRKAEMEKKMLEHEKEMFVMKIKKLEEETKEIRKHKDALQVQQKLNLTGKHKNYKINT